MEAWIVGGAIRDAALGEPVVDLDLAVPVGHEREVARAIGREAGGFAFPLSERHRTWRAVAPDDAWHADVTALRGETIEDDLARARLRAERRRRPARRRRCDRPRGRPPRRRQASAARGVRALLRGRPAPAPAGGAARGPPPPDVRPRDRRAGAGLGAARLRAGRRAPVRRAARDRLRPRAGPRPRPDGRARASRRWSCPSSTRSGAWRRPPTTTSMFTTTRSRCSSTCSRSRPTCRGSPATPRPRWPSCWPSRCRTR